MLKNKLWFGIILSIILLLFSINGLTAYYKYTQESGTNFYVGTADKADALEDTNEMRQIIDDLGALLVHSKRDDLYPKNGTTGGTIQIPEAGLKFGNDPINNDIAAYIAGEMTWQTKAELGIDLALYYLKTEINTQAKVETIWGVSLVNDGDLDLYYLKTAIDSQSEVETIWGVSLANDSELHTILTLGTANGLSLNLQELSLALSSTNTTGALSDTDWDIFNNKLSNITGESIGSLSNVDLTDLADGKILKYNFTTSKFECEDESGGGYTDLTSFVDQNNWKIFYSDGSGDIKELALGADNTYLMSNGATSAPTFEAGGGGASQLSDLSDVGVTTPTDKYVLVADGDSWESRALVEADISDLGTYLEDITGEELVDLSDVNTSTPTDKFVLIADGVDFESRALVEADISDLGTYATLTGDEVLTNKDINFVNALGTDHFYSGELDSQPVGESVVLGDLLYFNWTDKEWKKTDADTAATMPGLRIALESKADGQTCLMLIKGYIRDDSAFDFAGAMIYTSVTPGAMSSTAPTETGDQIQRVGVAKSADILFFDPSIDVGEI